MANIVLLSAGAAQSNSGSASDTMICAGILVVFIIFFVIGLKK